MPYNGETPYAVLADTTVTELALGSLKHSMGIQPPNPDHSPITTMNDTIWWRIRLFGPLHLAINGEEIRNPAGKSRSLLAWLLLHTERPHTREQVIDALWPELPPERARRALSDALYRLRETPAGVLVAAEGESLAIANPAAVWVDVQEFERVLHSSHLPDIDNALALAAAPLLPEIYDDWIIARRTTLQDARSALLRRRAAIAEEQNDLPLAQTLYQQIVEDDSLDEAAWRGRIRTLARMGHHRDAMDVFERLVQLLDEELGAPPETETSQLVAQIRREIEAQRAHAPGLSHFIGRVRERSHLIAALDGAIEGRGGLAVLLADTGMGRTALLHEVEHSARWRGVQVVWGRSDSNLYPAPYSPLREALSAALPQARFQQLTQFVREQWLDAIRQLLAEPAAQPSQEHQKGNSSPRLELPTAIRDQQELALAIANILRALGQIVPHLILLDDMQWADRSLWHLLDTLRLSLRQSRVLIVLSSRLAEAQHESTIRDRLTSWDQDGSVAVHTLGGFSEGELSELLARHQLLPTKREKLAQIHLDSGGNPMLAMMLAAAPESTAARSYGDSTGSALADALTQDLLLRRFRALRTDQQDALEECAILGTQFTWQMWLTFRQAIVEEDSETPENASTAAGKGVKSQENRLEYPSFLQKRLAPNPALARLPMLAGQLEQQGILVLDGATYRFANTLLQSAIHHQIPADRACRLHRLAYFALEALPGLPPGQSLRHAQHAGLREQTFRHALHMGKMAAAAFSLYSARNFFTLACENAPELDSTHETSATLYDLYLNRSMVLGLLGARDEQHADLMTLATLADRLDDTRHIEAANRLANYLLIVGNTDEALSVASAALGRAEKNALPLAQALLHDTIARIQRERKQVDAAIHHAEEAYARYLALDNQRGISEITDLRAGLAYDTGDYRRAAQGHLEAANLFGAQGDILREARALNNLGTIYWELGDYAGARATHERAVRVCQESGDLLGESDNTDNLGGVYWSLGDYDEAIRHYSAALQMRRSMRDEWGIGISLGNLGSALLKQGNPKEALAYYNEAWTLYRKNGRRRSEGYVLHNIGCAHLELRDIKSAKEALREGLAIREEIGDLSKVIESRAGLALAHLADEEDEAAAENIRAALALLDAEEYPNALQQEVHCAAWQIAELAGDADAARIHLGKAEVAMYAICATLPPDSVATFLANVTLNRQILEALPEYSQVVEVTCARRDAGRGRPLRSDELCTVRWTISTPGDVQIGDATARRHRVLGRLLQEAAEQGGVPTDEQLADALGVSRRTVLRDRAALAAEP